MKTKPKQSGLTLTEVLTTIVIIVILTVVALPAINAFFDSMSSSGSAEAMISAALSNARAMAISRQRYVGVRFQKIYETRGPLFADQYMIFIVNDTTIGAYAFCAINGMKPVKLQGNIGAIDLYLGSVSDQQISNGISDPNLFNDASTFSIVFSPSGHLVIHKQRAVRKSANDDVFNFEAAVSSPTNPVGMFVVDGANELSRRSCIIYDTKEFRRAYEQEIPYSGYLQSVAPVYINPYTGTLISSN